MGISPASMAITMVIFIAMFSYGVSAKEYCISKPGVQEKKLVDIMGSLCTDEKVDCQFLLKPKSSPCFTGKEATIEKIVSFVMNRYFRREGSQPSKCNFSGNGVITEKDPSYGHCIFD